MRFIPGALLALLLSGCAANKTAGPAAMLGGGQAGKAGVPPPSSSRETKPSNPTVTADERLFGKVVSVNPVLRFVVMDFPVFRMPVVDQRLNIYRNGQKVGEIKVTGPSLETTIAGDLAAGEAQVGDEVRED